MVGAKRDWVHTIIQCLGEREKDIGTVVGTGTGPGKNANQTGGINVWEGMYYKDGGASGMAQQIKALALGPT